MTLFKYLLFGIKEILLLLIMLLPKVTCPIPGVFYWSPRLGLDLSIPTTESLITVHQPNKKTIADGLVVMIDGYQAGLTIIGLAAGLSSAKSYPYLDPTSAYFYTDAYRWGLRYASLISSWLGGNGGHYATTHKTWRRRFYYMDEFVPKWLRPALFYVKQEEWEKEEAEFKRFKKYAEPAFGKHYHYPSKTWHNFRSEDTAESVENLDISSDSVKQPG